MTNHKRNFALSALIVLAAALLCSTKRAQAQNKGSGSRGPMGGQVFGTMPSGGQPNMIPFMPAPNFRPGVVFQPLQNGTMGGGIIIGWGQNATLAALQQQNAMLATLQQQNAKIGIGGLQNGNALLQQQNAILTALQQQNASLAAISQQQPPNAVMGIGGLQNGNALLQQQNAALAIVLLQNGLITSVLQQQSVR